MYGAEPGSGGFANNCLLARRLVEQGVRYVQLFDWGWDCHGTGPVDDLITHLPEQVQGDGPPGRGAGAGPQAARPARRHAGRSGAASSAARRSTKSATAASSSAATTTPTPSPSGWPAAASSAGIAYGETDDLGYHIVSDKIHVHDLQATILHALGIDPFKFSFPYQGLNQRLIGPAGRLAGAGKPVRVNNQPDRTNPAAQNTTGSRMAARRRIGRRTSEVRRVERAPAGGVRRSGRCPSLPGPRRRRGRRR